MPLASQTDEWTIDPIGLRSLTELRVPVQLRDDPTRCVFELDDLLRMLASQSPAPHPLNPARFFGHRDIQPLTWPGHDTTALVRERLAPFLQGGGGVFAVATVFEAARQMQAAALGFYRSDLIAEHRLTEPEMRAFLQDYARAHPEHPLYVDAIPLALRYMQRDVALFDAPSRQFRLTPLQ